MRNEKPLNLPYLAVGANELKEVAGNTAPCPNCHKRHKITFGTTDGKENKMLGFVNCGKESFLVTIEGKLL